MEVFVGFRAEWGKGERKCILEQQVRPCLEEIFEMKRILGRRARAHAIDTEETLLSPRRLKIQCLSYMCGVNTGPGSELSTQYSLFDQKKNTPIVFASTLF